MLEEYKAVFKVKNVSKCKVAFEVEEIKSEENAVIQNTI